MVMMLKGKAESLELDFSREIRSGTHLPTVIRLRHYVHVPFRQLPLTRRNVFPKGLHCINMQPVVDKNRQCWCIRKSPQISYLEFGSK